MAATDLGALQARTPTVRGALHTSQVQGARARSLQQVQARGESLQEPLLPSSLAASLLAASVLVEQPFEQLATVLRCRALESLETAATDADALQERILTIRGALHTTQMQCASAYLLKHLQARMSFVTPPQCIICMNAMAEGIGPQGSPDEINAVLGKQFVSHVLRKQTMEAAAADGCEELHDLGPSKQLRAMRQRNKPAIMETDVPVCLLRSVGVRPRQLMACWPVQLPGRQSQRHLRRAVADVWESQHGGPLAGARRWHGRAGRDGIHAMALPSCGAEAGLARDGR
mmetsp:Transcript_26584/g.82757  ORF Transcript_26584/g.82757 Transcript_26584/m.82757 type:complete len:288 (-) Transcript_26584:405-1268(-)